MRAQGNTCAGPAGLRNAIATGALLDVEFQGADGLFRTTPTAEFTPILVIRNLHIGVVKKAIRLSKVTGQLKLLGPNSLVRLFEKEMLKETKKRQE
jgi:hypothetical protein